MSENTGENQEGLSEESSEATVSDSVEAVESVQAEEKPQAVVEEVSSSAPAEKEAADTAEESDTPKYRDDMFWYVVHTYSGYEMRVKLGLEERVRNAGLQEQFGGIVVPEEKIVELVRGEKKTSTRKFFPGYILVQCDLNDDTWHTVKDTPKVTGFVGDSHRPQPLSKEEVQSLLDQMEGGASATRATVDYEHGDAVKIVDGPFVDFNGTVDDVKPDKGKLRILISIFGRATPVELDFVQVEKV